MKQNLKRLAGALALCAVLAGCALLPTALAWVRDYQQHGAVRTTKMEPIAMGSDEQYSFLQHLKIISSENQIYGDVQSMRFTTGVNFDEQGAKDNVKKQLDNLYELGLSPVRGTDVQMLVVESVNLGADIENPACSIMIWSIRVYSEDGILYVRMDDDTGLVLSLESVGNGEKIDKWVTDLGLSAYAKAWAGYLGLTLERGYDKHFPSDEDLQMDMEKYDVLYEESMDMLGQETIYDKEGKVLVRTLRILLSDGQDSIVYNLFAGEPGFGIVF